MSVKIAILIYILFTCSVFFYSLANPVYNWDMIPYVAVAKNFEIKDAQKLHAFVYDGLKQAVPPQTFQELVTGDYRKTISKNPEAFSEQLSFYRFKIIYILLLAGLGKLGMPIFFASHFISAVAVFAGLWLLFPIIKKNLSPLFIALFALLSLLFRITWLAGLSTPDGLAFLIMIAIAYLLLEKKRALLFALPLAIFVRTDLIILGALMTLYTFFRFPKWRAASVISFVLSCAAYLGLNAYFENYTWQTLFYFSFIESVPYPSRITEINVAQYLHILFEQTLKLFMQKEFLAYLAAIFITLAGFRRNPFIALIIIMFLYTIIHFLLFPATSLRFFIAPFLLAAFGMLFVIQQKKLTS